MYIRIGDRIATFCIARLENARTTLNEYLRAELLYSSKDLFQADQIRSDQIGRRAINQCSTVDYTMYCTVPTRDAPRICRAGPGSCRRAARSSA